MSRRRPAKQQIVMACGVCGADAIEAYVCPACLATYRQQLAGALSLARSLRLEHTRQTVKGSAVTGRGSAEQPLPYVEPASRALDALKATLTSACRTLALDQPLPINFIGPMSAWLLTIADSVALRPEGPDIVAELMRVTKRGLRICDSPPEKRFVGRCACNPLGEPRRPDAELRAAAGEEIIECGACGTSWRVDMLVDMMDEAIRDELVEWDALAGYATESLGIPRSTLDTWQRRGRILPTHGGGTRYRVGDLINLNEQRKARRAS